MQHLSRMSDQGIELSLVLPSEPLSQAVFAAGVAKVGSIFGIDYVGRGGEPTPDVLKVRMLWEMLRKRQWTDAEFTAALDRFLETVRFPTWTPADFFGAEKGSAAELRPKVYPHSWYLAQIHANKLNADAIGTYRIEGHDKPVWGWKHEIGDRLPVWDAVQQEPIAQLPPHHVSHPPADVTRIATLRQSLQMEADLEAAQESLRRLRSKYETATKERDDLLRTLSAANTRIAELEMMLFGDESDGEQPDEEFTVEEMNEDSPEA